MPRRSRRRSNSSGLPYLVVGLALGLAVAAGVYFSDLRSGAGVPTAAERSAPARGQTAVTAPAAGNAAIPAPAEQRGARSAGPADSGAASAAAPAAGRAPAAAATSEVDGADTAASSADERRFDFYDILPRYEVLVPDEVETVAQPAARAAEVATPGSYVLQTGSFRSHADADRMQASLALLGVESRIQKVAIDAGEFHRVRIGPVDDLDELNRVRDVLRQAGIESLMMKVD